MSVEVAPSLHASSRPPPEEGEGLRSGIATATWPGGAAATVTGSATGSGDGERDGDRDGERDGDREAAPSSSMAGDLAAGGGGGAGGEGFPPLGDISGIGWGTRNYSDYFPVPVCCGRRVRRRGERASRPSPGRSGTAASG